MILPSPQHLHDHQYAHAATATTITVSNPVPPSCAPEHLHPEYAQHLNILHDNFRRDLSLATTLLDDWIAKGQLHRRDFRPREGEGILDSDLSPVTTTALLKRQRGQKDGGHKMNRGKSCENEEQRSDEASRRHMKFPRLHVESVKSSKPKIMNKQAIAHPAEKHFDRLGLEQERSFRDGVSDWVSSLNYAELIA